MPFGTVKLEWCFYPMVKNFDDMFIRLDTTHERDRYTDTHTHIQTHRHRMMAKCGLVLSRAVFVG